MAGENNVNASSRAGPLSGSGHPTGKLNGYFTEHDPGQNEAWETVDAL